MSRSLINAMTWVPRRRLDSPMWWSRLLSRRVLAPAAPAGVGHPLRVRVPRYRSTTTKCLREVLAHNISRLAGRVAHA